MGRERFLSRKARGRIIRQRRMKLQLTQMELAARIGCAQSQISDVERGQKAISEDLLTALSRHLDLPLYGLVFAAHGCQQCPSDAA